MCEERVLTGVDGGNSGGERIRRDVCQNTEFPPSTGGIPTVNKLKIEMGVLLVF